MIFYFYFKLLNLNLNNGEVSVPKITIKILIQQAFKLTQLFMKDILQVFCSQGHKISWHEQPIKKNR
ncbi:hypothetical protein IJ00_21135 [Calothrix sp. 336/3]|nr:hypothetical protein IJ00_21135 [Calothrix sp. 336/3]